MHHAGIAQLRQDQVGGITPAITYTDTVLGVTQVTITYGAQCHPAITYTDTVLGVTQVTIPYGAQCHPAITYTDTVLGVTQVTITYGAQCHPAITYGALSPRLQSHTAPCHPGYNRIQHSVSPRLQSHTALCVTLQTHTVIQCSVSPR